MKTKIIMLITLAFIGLSNLHAQVGIGTTTPDPSAELDLSATDKGFLPPRLTTAERDAIASPAEGLTIYNTDNKCLETYNSTVWISLCDGTIASGPCAGVNEEFTFNGLTYRVIPGVEDPTGVEQCWLDRNLGATAVTGQAGATLAALTGYLYQWGRSTDGHQIPTSSLSSTKETNAFSTSSNFITTSTQNENWLTSNPTDLWANESSPNNPCPPGFRVPTATEFLTMINGQWELPNGNLNGESYFKIPDVNLRFHFNPGFGGFVAGDLVQDISEYWTSTAQTGVTATRVSIVGNSQNDPRAFGFPVRCIKD
jgi:uncharacterized protein (TIGR02145 family)